MDDTELGLVWVDCPYPVVSAGLACTLEKKARVHIGREPPEGDIVPSSIILNADDVEGISEGIERVQEPNPRVPVLVFGLRVDLPLAWASLQAGARGFIHAGLSAEQLLRAVAVASRGEIVAPRQLLEYLVANEGAAPPAALSARQREIVGLVADGLSNAQIAREVYLSESTVKQHLRAAYKALGVNNRTEASKRVLDEKN